MSSGKFHFIESFAVLLTAVIAVGCDGKKELASESYHDAEFHTVKVNLDNSYYNSISERLEAPEYVILQENDSFLYADLDKLVLTDRHIYILDQFGARTVIQFDKTGRPLRHIGGVGEGPGEYSYPGDVSVTDSTINILDISTRKLLTYDLDGNFRNERKYTCGAEGFTILGHGNIVFNLMPEETRFGMTVYTPDFTPVYQYEYYPEGYKGGYMTVNALRKMNGGAIAYNAPLDTLLVLDNDGKVTEGLAFDFNGKGVGPQKKLQWLGEENRKDKGLYFTDTPFPIVSDLWMGQIGGGEFYGTVVFNTTTNEFGAMNMRNPASVADISEPVGTDGEGRIVNLLTIESAENCPDYHTLPPEIRSALEKGMRVLAFRNLQSEKQSR